MRAEHVRIGRAIQQRTGQTFHLATRLLPERVREPTYVCYGFFRVCDEVVDDPGDRSPAEQVARLEDLRAAALGEREADHPVVAAFSEVRETYHVPAGEIEAFVDAMAADATTDRYETGEDLRWYVRGSAAAVGVMLSAIMQPDDPERAKPHAVALGEALQLTNFLRDVREDARERGRVYLPVETLTRHGASVEQVLDCNPTPGVRAAVATELRRAERRYRDGVAGIRYLPADCQFPVLLSAILYADYHRQIRDRGFDVFSDPPKLRSIRAARLLAESRVRWAFWSDPESVFAAVTDVETTTARRREEDWPDVLPARTR